MCPELSPPNQKSVVVILLISVGIEDNERDGRSELEQYPLLFLKSIGHPYNPSYSSQQLLHAHCTIYDARLQRQVPPLTLRRCGRDVLRWDRIYLLSYPLVGYVSP